jgi:hypothetical protein
MVAIHHHLYSPTYAHVPFCTPKYPGPPMAPGAPPDVRSDLKRLPLKMLASVINQIEWLELEHLL